MARTDNLNNFLTDVASAIKSKKGDTRNIKASEFDTEIMGLASPQGKIQIDKNGAYNVTDYAEANVEVTPKLQEKGVGPIKGFQEITPDEGYDGLSKVDVFPIPGDYIIPEGEIKINQNGKYDVTDYKEASIVVLPKLQEKGVAPSRVLQTVVPDEGYDGLSKVDVFPSTVEAKLQNKFVTPSKEFQTITADEGYDGLSTVDVTPISDEYVIPQGELIIYESGEYDVKEKEKAIVRTVNPSGTLNINKNGIYRVYDYEFVDVNTGSEIDGLLDGTITNLYNNKVTEIRAYSFYYVKTLISVDLPEVLSIGMNAFGNCTNLINVSLPKLSYFSSTNVFNNCTSLTKLDFPKLNKIQSASFNNCTSLATLILRNSSVCTLVNANAFIKTPIESGTGYIYVPDNLVDTYKTTTNWTTYANQIKPISELEVS